MILVIPSLYKMIKYIIIIIKYAFNIIKKITWFATLVEK